MSILPTAAQALRHFADTLEIQASRLDCVLWRPSGERSTTAEAYRLSASLARQQAHKLERLERQLEQRAGVEA